MEIRRFSKTDSIEEVCRVYAESWRSAYRGIVPQEYLDNLDARRFMGFITEDLPRIWLASDGEHIVGSSSYSAARDKDKPGWGEIVSIYLLPGYTRRGIGTGLLRASMDSLFKMNCKKIYCFALEDNYPARDFYVKNGFFQGADSREITIGGKRLLEIRYIFEKTNESPAT